MEFFLLFLKEYLNAKSVSHELMKNGLIAVETKDHILRIAPALNINEEQLRAGIDIMVKTINTMPTNK